MKRERVIHYLQQLLNKVASKGGTDLLITADAAPAIRLHDKVLPLTQQQLTATQAKLLVHALMNKAQIEEFEQNKECNFVLQLENQTRLNIHTFMQRGSASMVLRQIPHIIPTFKQLNLPPLFEEIAMLPQGLVIIAGGSNTGKSTTLAALIDHRNRHSQGHIITLEDSIEFLHQHKKSLVTQREIGIDTSANIHTVLKNMLHHLPDVIMLGEIRDKTTLAYAIRFAETGHLCLTSIRAANIEATLQRIIQFFPIQQRQSALNNLSNQLKLIIAQKLIKNSHKKYQIPVLETLINNSSISTLIKTGQITKIKKLIAQSNEQGMFTFDQSLFNLIEQQKITLTEGLQHAEVINDLRLKLKLHSQLTREKNFYENLEHLSLQEIDQFPQ